jgi:hypothetical protein
MKQIFFTTAILSIILFVASCIQTEKIPPSIGTIDQATALLTGKVWQVTDVATISGSRKSLFENEQSNNETIVAPAKEALNWLSSKKGTVTNTDFINAYYKKNLKISIALNKDSIATTKGMDAQQQIFSINNYSEKNEPKGLKLSLSGGGEGFSEMGAGKFTATYYILGANEKKLYLLTPNELNGLQVVLLLEAK